MLTYMLEEDNDNYKLKISALLKLMEFTNKLEFKCLFQNLKKFCIFFHKCLVCINLFPLFNNIIGISSNLLLKTFMVKNLNSF